MAQLLCSVVSADDRARLEAIVADRNQPQKHVTRARIVLLSHRLRTFKRSRDPDFIAKLEANVGLYMAPPRHAMVLRSTRSRKSRPSTALSQGCRSCPASAGP